MSLKYQCEFIDEGLDQAWAVMKKYYRNKILDIIKNMKNNKELTYKLIERFVKISKTHRNIGDQQKGFIQKAIL